MVNWLQYGVHRVPLVNSENQTESILAQGDVVEFIREQFDKQAPGFVELADMTIGQLDMVPGQVISIRDNCTLLLAFEAIIANNVSGIAIVNREGRLVGNLSATDFEGITETNFVNLDRELRDLIKTKVRTMHS
jgi:CBS domain-containing protein